MFDYDNAISRNIGLVTIEEQKLIRSAVVAIPGMGGAGGSYLISLVRQGFENFKIADFDVYELKNFNRQYGVRTDTIGRKKAEVMKEEALRINPNCKIEIFGDGLTNENIEDFLNGVSVVIDAIDLFEIEARRMLYANARKNNISVVFAAPIGFSTAFYIASPEGPSIDEYFDFNDNTDYWEKLIKFLIGLMPKLLQQPYMNQNNVSLKDKKGPSSMASINLCVGVAMVNVLKIVLKRGVVKSLPYYHQFDAMRDIYVVKKLRRGNKNIIQKIKIAIMKKKYL